LLKPFLLPVENTSGKRGRRKGGGKKGKKGRRGKRRKRGKRRRRERRSVLHGASTQPISLEHKKSWLRVGRR